MPWWALFVFELPAWYAWLVVAPGVFVLARRFPLGEGTRARSLPVHLVASLAVSFGVLVVCEAVRHLVRPSVMRPYDPTIAELYPRTVGVLVILYFTLVVVQHAMAYRQAYNARVVQQSRLEAELAHTQLEVLKAQLQPHFLFNTLNAISALVTRDAAGARRMLARLSDLLRLTLRDAEQHEIPVEGELEFLECYVDLQKLRYRDRLAVEFRVDPRARGLLVPRMILQPLVENAIRHGLPDDERDTARIVVAVEHPDGRLRLRVADNGPGLGAERPPREGVGLQNTRARVQQLYGSAASLAFLQSAEGGLEVVVEIPARTPP